MNIAVTQITATNLHGCASLGVADTGLRIPEKADA